MHCSGWPEKLHQHKCIARILKTRIENLSHEVEKGPKVRVSTVLGCLFGALGDGSEEGKDLL